MAIYFIRHGQSKFNAAFKGEIDPMIFDAPLTELGFAQAAEARKKLSELNIARVITSPLTRAIQTAKTIFDGIAPIEVQHGHHELLKYSGDIGRHPNKLSLDFPDLSFDHLPSRWWHGHDVGDVDIQEEPIPLFQKRLAHFVAQLDEMDNEQIAIIGHGNAFQEITGFMMENCEVHQYR